MQKKSNPQPSSFSPSKKHSLVVFWKTQNILNSLGRPFFLFFLLLFQILSLATSLVAKGIGNLLRTIYLILDFVGSLFLSPVKLILHILSSKKQREPGVPTPQKQTRAGSRKWIKATVAVFALISLFTISFWWAQFIFKLPQPGQLVTRSQALSTKIYDREGNILFKMYRNENRTLLPLGEAPLELKQATIAIEDAEFYNHHGFSTRGIIRAFRRNLAGAELSGGSTITQQLVKNTLLSPEKTITRKIKEIILAIRVEMTFTKDQILEMYLNEVSYGGSSYGIEEAAQVYFKKSARELTLAQSALLAGLPKAPTTYSPFGANPQLARARQLEVLSRMVQENFITPEEAENAGAEKLEFAPQKTDIKAPHFVMYIKQLLVEKYGERMIEEGGLSVYTTLDPKIQEMSESIVLREVKKVENLRISNGAALVTNPGNGEILAMVGSKDYFDQKIDGNFNITTALRQPGSSIKPLNYAYAIENKLYTPSSTISDTPVTFKAAGSPPYSPKNYDGRFHGIVSIRTALGSSYNIPAVQILASYGVQKMVDLGRKLGISTWQDPSRYGLSLTLGGAEVKMIDMSVLYSTFANSGKKTALEPIIRVETHTGKVLEEQGCKETQEAPVVGRFIRQAQAAEAAPVGCSLQALSTGTAFLITNILKDNRARSPAFGPTSRLIVKNHPEVAVKTGTTQNQRDNWAIGYTQDYVVTVWVGNNNNLPMARVSSGVTGATPIWQNIFTELLKNSPSKEWPIPEDVVKLPFCADQLPGLEEYFLKGTEPKGSCVARPKEEGAEEKTEEEKEKDKILEGRSTPKSPSPQKSESSGKKRE